jgi:hypothetical protein
MSSPEVPRWLVVLGSVAITGHLLAVVAGALAAPSGPWFMPPEGADLAPPPPFARTVSDVTNPNYLRPLHLAHSYRFAANRPGEAGVYFEVRLKDEAGNSVATVKVPGEGANRWVRHRQALLARGLIPDQQFMPRPGEAVAPPGQDVPTVPIWEPAEPVAQPQHMRLRRMPEHLVPRDRPVSRPNEWSLLLVRSYARHLCRVHGAATAELARHTRYAIPPLVLQEEPPPGAFDELIVHYGELPR